MNFYRFQFLPKSWQTQLVKTFKLYRGIFFHHNLKYSDIHYQRYNSSRILGPQSRICYAPYKSIFFGVDGNASACCLNRSDMLGNFPEQSIKDIWNGEKNQKFRNKLSNYEFPKGCFQCKERIESGNFDAVEAMKYDVFPWKNKYPVMLEFELSNQCNLQCIMCSPQLSSSIQNNKHSHSVDNNLYNDEFLKQLDEFIPHLVKAKFLGGEPFIIPVYYKIWEKIINLNPKCIIMIQTNGTVLNDKIKSLLSKGDFRIGISIDSFNKENYELIRKNSNYEKVLENIAFFADNAIKKNYTMGISVCPMQQNWKELPEIIIRSNKLKALVFFNTVLTPEVCSLYTLPYMTLENILNELSMANLPSGNSIERKNKIHFENFLNQLHFWCEDKRSWQNLNIQGIIQLFVVKFEKYLLQNPQEPHKTISFYQEKLTNFITRFEDTELFRYALKKSIETPTEIIVNDLNNRDVDDLCALYKTNMKKLEAGTKQCNE